MLFNLGLAVVREIPVSVLAGLVNGAYRLHGGVVRDAGGRIVAHLLSSSGPADLAKQFMPGLNTLSALVGSGQIYTMAKDVAQIQQMLGTVLALSSASTVLSGLGLVASVAGSAFLNQKLNSIQEQLKYVERLLNEQHVSALKSAVDSLRHAEQASDPETRRALLVAAKQEFAKAAHFYGSQFADPRTVKEIPVLEDCFSVAAVGSALCLSELGMFGAAAADFEGHFDRWVRLSRQHVQRHVIGKDRARLLGHGFVDEFPASELVATLDFAYGEEKSWRWIDELRKEKGGVWTQSIPREAVDMGAMLRAKHGALDAFAAHLRFLDAKKLTATGFVAAVREAANEVDASDVCVVDGQV
jgi:hypothetical protein